MTTPCPLSNSCIAMRIPSSLPVLASLLIVSFPWGYSCPDAPIVPVEIPMIDAHNHDAGAYEQMMPLWDRYGVRQVILFGHISEPAAMRSDALAWEAYRRFPDRLSGHFHVLPAC